MVCKRFALRCNGPTLNALGAPEVERMIREFPRSLALNLIILSSIIIITLQGTSAADQLLNRVCKTKIHRG